jgi:hypothetical protein
VTKWTLEDFFEEEKGGAYKLKNKIINCFKPSKWKNSLSQLNIFWLIDYNLSLTSQVYP